MLDVRKALETLLVEAGELALAQFGQIRGERKDDNTLFTEADMRAEAVLVAGLRERFPGDAIVGEEGARVAGGERTWFVDPIDGTSSYLEGLSYWGPTVGLVDAQGPLVGALYLPRLREFWFGCRQGGAWRNASRLAPLSDRPPDDDSVIYVPSRFQRTAWIDFPGKCRNLGSLASHVTMVAAGAAVAAIVPPGWRPWDVAGAFCLLEEVGGVAVTRSGDPADLATSSKEAFLVGSPAAVDYLLAPGRIRFR